ncbi:MAG: S9 family peptidase [Treponema sp.]|jgi:dienelactone hydrolase|nr:S9 family peptidase [Treponema sp.]
MNKNFLKPDVVLIMCVIMTLVCGALASFIQSGFGSVAVTTGFFTPESSGAADGLPVRIAYKLYKPQGADAAHPAPAVLAMHGYQNDKDTSAAFCVELARRGIVVLSVDLYGHGDTSPGMRGRGWGKYKITNLEKTISGPRRFLIMMTFSILDFFRPEIAAGVVDSSMGGKSAWSYLAALPFVDSNRMGVTGHSMGTWASWSVAAAFPGHRAIVLQCGEPFPTAYYDSQRIQFNNVLILQALYDEFDNFRDYGPTVTGLEKTPLRYRDFMGQDAPVDWNKTYGSFADGSARRMELLRTNHRLVTYDDNALTAAMSWFTNALEITPVLADSNHVSMIKEFLGLLAMLAALISMFPLFLILTRFKFFAPLAQPLAENPRMLSPPGRRTAVLTAVLISGLTFPFLSQLGHGLLPLPENVFRMTVGNGFITWLSFLMLVSLFMLIRWFKRGGGRQAGWALSDLGLINQMVTPRSLIIKVVIVSCILTGMMYILVCISVGLFNLDFRFIWPFFRPFTPLRLSQFLVYLPFYAAFFTVNAGVKLYGQLRLPEFTLNGKKSAALTQLAWWGYSVLVMLGGVLLIALIEYIPFFLGYGPGADLLFTATFGGPFMSVMILLVPQFAVFFFLSTWFYRKSGTVYTGSFVLAILATWVLCGGSSMF